MAQERRNTARAGDPPEAAAFDRVVERAVRVVCEVDPVRASWLGLRGRHDHLLADCSPEAMERTRGLLCGLASAFESLDPRQLDSAQRIDRELASGALSTLVSLAVQRPTWRTMPQAAMAEVLSGIAVHLARGCATAEERGAALLGRLRAVPDFLEQAQRSVQEPPAVFTEIAILAAQNAQRSLPLVLHDFRLTLAASPLVRLLQRAEDRALRALEGYGEFLRSSVMPRSTGDVRLGTALYNRILREEHRVPINSDDLVVLGERIYHQTLRELRALAGRLRLGRNWSWTLGALVAEHPSAEDLVPSYREAVGAARRFLVERELATVPPGEDLLVLQTPLFASRRFPHAGYLPCGASDGRMRGILLVTVPEATESAAHCEAFLRGHSIHAIPGRAVRETYPGRHLQFARAARCGRTLRLLFPSLLLTQGWALYCEEMMREAGFMADERVRFLELREKLRCACRILVDVALHSGRITVNEAVVFLMRKAKIERADALMEVYRCCESPTEMMSCLIGKLLIEEMREDERARCGPGFALGGFHDAVLDQGALPPDLMRSALGLPRRRSDLDLFRSLTRLRRRSAGTGPPAPPAR